VFLRNVPAAMRPGDVVEALVEDADAHDLYGVIAD
jgi:ribosomal protein S12 methylthiotransferase